MSLWFGGSRGRGSSATNRWAVITCSAAGGTYDESPSPEIATQFDTVAAGSSGHGVTVSAGIVTLPAPSSGKQWECVAELNELHSATGSSTWQWYSDPSGTNAAIGVSGAPRNDITNINRNSTGGCADPIAWLASAGTVGVRCIQTFSTNTQQVNTGSRMRFREVSA